MDCFVVVVCERLSLVAVFMVYEQLLRLVAVWYMSVLRLVAVRYMSVFLVAS